MQSLAAQAATPTLGIYFGPLLAAPGMEATLPPGEATSAEHKLVRVLPAKLFDAGSRAISSNILTSSSFLPIFL